MTPLAAGTPFRAIYSHQIMNMHKTTGKPAATQTDKDTLTPKQQRAIAALLSERSIKDAAKAARVPERTLSRWLGDAAFANELRGAQLAMISTTIRRLTHITTQAIDTISDVMSNGANDSVKLRAADIALGRLFDLKQIADFEARIAALERRAEHE
jgi:hypothetical protein